ncbi:HNH endonuclease family protein [Streptomyces sp. NPDC051214]|uniref:HNH endonuclease family protein n=1 Tax=Streptomyces sp. NPDC051214 TaxID=3155282 RepID=UPI0034452E89
MPLAEAWDSGARDWRAAERQAYANDLGEERALIAVTARSNRSKAAQDPSTWMPPAEDNRCEYVSQWIAIKTRMKLAIDPVRRPPWPRTRPAARTRRSRYASRDSRRAVGPTPLHLLSVNAARCGLRTRSAIRDADGSGPREES